MKNVWYTSIGLSLFPTVTFAQTATVEITWACHMHTVQSSSVACFWQHIGRWRRLVGHP